MWGGGGFSPVLDRNPYGVGRGVGRGRGFKFFFRVLGFEGILEFLVSV